MEKLRSKPPQELCSEEAEGYRALEHPTAALLLERPF